MNDLISPEYREQNRLLHEQAVADGKRWGDTGWTHADEILKFCKEIGAQDILDYGCGQGMLKLEFEKRKVSIEVKEYDPAIRGKDAVPKNQSDLIVCTDVMEHVEQKKVLGVLANIYDISRLGAFFNISCKLAKATLPNGQNAHATVNPPEWWIETIRKFPWKIHHTEQKKSSVKIWISNSQ